MLDPEAITTLLFDHIIMKAEQSLAAAAVARSVREDELRGLEAEVADLYDQRRIILEEMMHLPFRPARG